MESLNVFYISSEILSCRVVAFPAKLCNKADLGHDCSAGVTDVLAIVL